MEELTNSQANRQWILNSDAVVDEVKRQLNMKKSKPEEEVWLTKYMVANFYYTDLSTVERYIKENIEEIKGYGLQTVEEDQLENLLGNAINRDYAMMQQEGPQVTLFSFEAFLDLGLIMAECENAKIMRQVMLDIAIDIVNYETGGGTLYYNQNEEYFYNWFLEKTNSQKEFMDALKNYVDMGVVKYPLYADMIYQSIFSEKSIEWKCILQRISKESKDVTSEVFNSIAVYECGVAEMIEERSKRLKRKLYVLEVNELFKKIEQQLRWRVHLNAIQQKVKFLKFISDGNIFVQTERPIKVLKSEERCDRIGISDKKLEEIMKNNSDVLIRLKERN